MQFSWKEISILPIQWHSLCLGLFASIIAPFGGFFASGFKRAFKIKVCSQNLCFSNQDVSKYNPFRSGRNRLAVCFHFCRTLVIVFRDMVELPTEWIAR